MSASQSFPNQPTASSSNLGGSKPQLILKVLQSSQSASLVPFSNVLPSAPPMAKKMQCVAFECTNYPSSKKFCSFKSVFWLLQFHILTKLPLIVTVTIKEQDQVIKELQDSLIESHNLQLAAEALAQGCGVELSQFHGVYKELCHLLNIGDLPLEPVTTSTVAPMDIWGGPLSESFPFETKSDSTPNSLSNFVPSLNTTSLPSNLIETRNTSPVVIFLSGHPNAYFICTREDPLTYSLVKRMKMNWQIPASIWL
ncbi:hypothetical protein GYMLUDRAFT_249934 [Collybiopsis luxurians FD-317 M1]|uniref:Uncharacterized protein n=1 Tax=Collybiopsis luxurians FD-317 M1 TaxID=944289 RepID=A0A0D0CG21_9AGAR|nr:hypothetical protein GYMLUDRAFT_249934 [Collybiopsis luxurians FD-317 M1]